jgi:hypothetical protein
MTKHTGPTHVVVDGSNIATEGRSVPSLAQLNEAVLAFMDEHRDITVTVVVDATFGHRISKSEAQEFDEAVANNELVAPPAGAVGRGDAFVLGIADKAGALVLSNDSFQEFHGQYEWLFDQGRLIGGKPVPHVGWIFVERVPVRGPTSRKAVRDSQRKTSDRPTKTAVAKSSESKPASTQDQGGTKKATAKAPGRRGRVAAAVSAHEPMPVPTTPPPGPALRSDSGYVNDLLPFLEFVEHHPVGTSVNAIVDTYSSHGAYVMIGAVRAYVPLRLMSSPPPKSAREVMKIGDAITLVVAEYAPARRSIDCALPHMAAGTQVEDPAEVIIAAVAASQIDGRSPRRTRSRRSPAMVADEIYTVKEGTEMATKPAKKAAPKKAVAKKPAAKKAAAKKAAPKKAAAKKPAAKKAAPKKAVAKKPAAKKAAAKKPAAKKAAPKKAVAKKPAVKKAAVKKAAPKKAAPKKAVAKKPAVKKPAAKKAAVKKSPARR